MAGKEIKRDNFTVQVGYSKEAREKKLLKFISKSGDEFEIKQKNWPLCLSAELIPIRLRLLL
jgi:hypothetical protein